MSDKLKLGILADIQNKLVIQKTQENKFGGFMYRSAEDILAALKPLLAEHDCFVKMSDEIIMVGTRIYVKSTVSISHGNNLLQSASAYAREPDSQKGMVEPMLTGSCSSYARKYALSGLFAIDDTEIIDTLNDEPISDGQVKMLERLITEVGADTDGFVKFLKVESLDKLLASKFDKAVQALNAKRKS